MKSVFLDKYEFRKRDEWILQTILAFSVLQDANAQKSDSLFEANTPQKVKSFDCDLSEGSQAWR